MEMRQGTAGPGLEERVRLPEPDRTVPVASLDGMPGRRPVERVDDGAAGKVVGVFELARHVPSHVHEDAAIVEDDAGEGRSDGHEQPIREATTPYASRWMLAGQAV